LVYFPVLEANVCVTDCSQLSYRFCF